jgi:hypothetical protein
MSETVVYIGLQDSNCTPETDIKGERITRKHYA